MTVTDKDLEILEEEIKENIEWLGTSRKDEIECISIENLEGVLKRFFNKTIKLTLE
jgi:hypothetical protein